MINICVLGLPLLIGMIIGVAVTSVIVLFDWHEHPKRLHGYWGTVDHKLYICSRCNHMISRTPTKFCENCGAEMSKYEKIFNCSEYMKRIFTKG